MHYGIQQLSNLCYRSQGINIIFMTPNLLQPYLLTTFEQYSRGLAVQWPCYLQGPGFKPHLSPVEFFSCNKVSPVNN